jgi:hypothetical protein
MRHLTAVVPFAVLLMAVAVMMLPSRAAEAQLVPLELARELPGVPGPLSQLNSCAVTVDSNPDGGTDLVQCSDTINHVEIFCENRSATAVYYGNRTDDLDSVAPCISNDSSVCGRDAFRFSVRNGQLGADTASGSATLYCTEGR